MAGADVVEHDQEAELPQLRGQRAETRDLLEARLEELDGHVARQQAGGAHQRQQVGREGLVARSRRQVQVQKQQELVGAGVQPGEAADRGAPAHLLELVAQPLGGGHLEQRLRRDDAAVGGGIPRASASMPITHFWRTEKIG